MTELHGPNELVTLALEAGDAGFDFLVMSDHYHVWGVMLGMYVLCYTGGGGGEIG